MRDEYDAAPESARILSLQLVALVTALERQMPGLAEAWAQAASDRAMHATVIALFGPRLEPKVREDLLKAERITRGQADLVRGVAKPSAPSRAK